MRGAVAKRLRRQAREIGGTPGQIRRTYKALKRAYKHAGWWMDYQTRPRQTHGARRRP